MGLTRRELNKSFPPGIIPVPAPSPPIIFCERKSPQHLGKRFRFQDLFTMEIPPCSAVCLGIQTPTTIALFFLPCVWVMGFA